MISKEKARESLKVMNLKAASEKIGIHYNTLIQFCYKDIDPKYSTMKKISDFLESLSK